MDLISWNLNKGTVIPWLLDFVKFMDIADHDRILTAYMDDTVVSDY